LERLLKMEELKKHIRSFYPFAKKRMGFNKPPTISLKQDGDNAKNVLGKTAYYDPESFSITLFVTGRHPKDILRSLAHELVHHAQNCQGEFDNVGEMGEGYAQTNPHLREMEVAANRDGSMCLRDWEDAYKQRGEQIMAMNETKLRKAIRIALKKVIREKKEKTVREGIDSSKDVAAQDAARGTEEAAEAAAETGGSDPQEAGMSAGEKVPAAKRDKKKKELEESPSHPADDRKSEGEKQGRRVKKVSTGERIEEDKGLSRGECQEMGGTFDNETGKCSGAEADKPLDEAKMPLKEWHQNRIFNKLVEQFTRK